jgi:hypothetical protein
MTKKIYYEKRGRRYVPVSEYDRRTSWTVSPRAHTFVMCYPGGQSRRYNIDPNYAAMIAAGRVAEDAICRAIVKPAKCVQQRTPITPGQKRPGKSWQKS